MTGSVPPGHPSTEVDPQDLAQSALEYLNLPRPEIERNPKLKAPANATLVNLPTWFWVKDRGAVGADTNGTYTITATAGNVSATVIATTRGLQIIPPKPNPKTTCAPTRSAFSWSTGRRDADACTLAFAKASVGHPAGYPVQARVTWTATWTGTDNPTATPLAPVERTTTTNIPVAEVQTIVTLH